MAAPTIEVENLQKRDGDVQVVAGISFLWRAATLFCAHHDRDGDRGD
jgi:hypothetical protein